MAQFSDVLLTVDYDRTMTGPDGKIPQRNLDAVRWFIERGGTFTMNTGRSVSTYRPLLDVIPTNAPLLLYNGSAAYDNGKLVHSHPIDLPMWETIEEVAREFPDLNLEIQGENNHYLVNKRQEYVDFYHALGWTFEDAVPGADLGPFLKFSLFGRVHANMISDMFTGTPEELARFREAVDYISRRWGDKVELFMAAPRILDVHAKGVSKINAARNLQKEMGKKILVCVGDAENDLCMLDGADYAFCPADGVVADRYENVCPCGEGAVADVIYKKIPEILGISLDSLK